MPKIVNVEGVGPVNFPDDATDADIVSGLDDIAPVAVAEADVPPSPRPASALESVPFTPAEQQSVNIAAQRLDPRWRTAAPEPTLPALIHTGLQKFDTGVRDLFTIPPPVEPGPSPYNAFELASIDAARQGAELSQRITRVAHPIREGVSESAASGVEAMTTPSGVAMLAGATVAPQIALPAIFATVAPSIPDAVREVGRTYQERDWAGFTKAVADLGQVALVAGGTAKGMLRPTPRVVLPRTVAEARAEPSLGNVPAAGEVVPRETPIEPAPVAPVVEPKPATLTPEEQAAAIAQLEAEHPGIATAEPPAPAAETTPKPTPPPAPAPAEAPKPAPLAEAPRIITEDQVAAFESQLKDAQISKEGVINDYAALAGARFDVMDLRREAIAKGMTVAQYDAALQGRIDALISAEQRRRGTPTPAEQAAAPADAPLANARLLGSGPVPIAFSDRHSVSLRVASTDMTSWPEAAIRESLPSEIAAGLHSIERFRGSPAPAGLTLPGRVQLNFNDKASAQKAYDYFAQGETVAPKQLAVPAAPAARAEEAPAASPVEPPKPAAALAPAPVAAAKAQAEVTRVAATEGKRSAKAIKKELVARLEQAVKDAPESAASLPKEQRKVTIEIPDDGTFTVWNEKGSLMGLLARANRIKTDAGGKASIPRKGILSSEKAIARSQVEAPIEAARRKAEQERTKPPTPPPAPGAEPTAAAIPPAATEMPAPAAERTIPLINLRESEATPMALGKIKARDPQRWQDIVKYFKVGDTPGAIAKIAQEKIAEMKAREVPEPPKADVGKPEEPPPPQTTQYGMMMPGVEMLLGEMPGKTVSPTSEPFWNTERSFSQNISGVASWIRDLWRGFAMKQAPKITDSNRAAGESGVRYAAAPLVARAKGLEFAATVLRDTGVEPKKFGTALSEDNLRDIKDRWGEAAAKAIAEGDVEGAALAQDKSDAVRTLIGANRSPFKTEAEYQAFLNDPAVKTAIARHIQLWQEQKDPLFRQANDLDPDVPLAGRGKQTGARINLKALAPDEKGVAVVGGRPAKLRQLATKLRRDPFARRATGGGQAYEGDYNELMAHGFGTEYPIAAQHEFIKALIEAGDAKVTDKEFPEGMTIKGEKPVANILRLNPWRGKFLQVRRSLVDEYRAISNLDEPWKIPILTPFNDLMTKQSIQGFAEGSTHTSNLMMEIFTGLGPTNNPLLNGLIKSVGRADLLYSVPRVIIKAFQDTKPEMLRLAETGMAKEPYQGKMLGRILNGADRGVRLVSEQIYDGMAEKGWVENTETGKREFINQIGNYNKRLQPSLIRKLRDTGIQPFATAMQTFNVMGLRRLVGAPGAKATSNMAALALRADIAGGFIGFVALTTYLNYLLSGNAAGPKGTPLGAVGWKDEHGKTHFFNVGRLLGYERGARITGLGPYMEARRNGLTHEQALQAGGRSVASTVMSYPAGPGPRALYTVGTGMRMNQPTVREAPAVPPTESLNPFKTQLAKNIQTAVIEANPAISSLHDLREGKSASDIAEKQFGRYTPREGKSEGFYRALPKIVTKGQLIDYADDVVKEARKLPISQRMSYIQTRFNKDDLKAQYRNDVMTEIKRKGVLRYQ